MDDLQTWDLWYPGAGATGMSFARGRLLHTDHLLVHAAPDRLDVVVREDVGAMVAQGSGLNRTADTPIARLTLLDGRVERVDIWPKSADLGSPVLLPGGEVGLLRAWWNAPSGDEWRWQVEFYNRR